MGTGSRVVCAGGGGIGAVLGRLADGCARSGQPGDWLGGMRIPVQWSRPPRLRCPSNGNALGPPSIPAAGGCHAGAAGLSPATVVTSVSTRVTSWFKPIYGRSEAEQLGTAPESDLEGKLGLVVCALAV